MATAAALIALEPPATNEPMLMACSADSGINLASVHSLESPEIAHWCRRAAKTQAERSLFGTR